MWKKFLSQCASRKVGKAEWLALLLYIVGLITVQCFHEPWFDEAQAWQIARSSNIWELLFVVPHHEGHPQLWHLILYPFAHLGFPFHATVSAINITFCTAAVALLLFRSPFPKWMRCVMPFTFYFFYQYGVVSRPYCIMMLAFMLVSMSYTGRNAHPFRYIGSMCLLCLTSAYGILFSGGLCAVWTLEIAKEYQMEKKWKQVLKDKRLYALFGILILAVFLAFCIVPAEDIYYPNKFTPLLERLKNSYLFFLFPAEALICYAYGYDMKYVTAGGLAATCVFGACAWAALILITKQNRKLLTFLIPYGLFSTFGVVKYVSSHHMGIGTLFFLFIFWIMLEQPEGLQIPSQFKAVWNGLETPTLRSALKVLGVIAMIVPVGYSGYASVKDLTWAYGPTAVTGFIKKNHLENRKILTKFVYSIVDHNQLIKEQSVSLQFVDDTLPFDHPPIEKVIAGYSVFPSVNLPYFESNTMFPYFNNDAPGIDYVRHINTADTYKEVFKSWQEIGLPDFVFGNVMLDEIFTPEQLEGVTYYWIDTLTYGNISKASTCAVEDKIYIRGDLLDEYPQFHVLTYAEDSAQP